MGLLAGSEDRFPALPNTDRRQTQPPRVKPTHGAPPTFPWLPLGAHVSGILPPLVAVKTKEQSPGHPPPAPFSPGGEFQELYPPVVGCHQEKTKPGAPVRFIFFSVRKPCSFSTSETVPKKTVDCRVGKTWLSSFLLGGNDRWEG